MLKDGIMLVEGDVNSFIRMSELPTFEEALEVLLNAISDSLPIDEKTKIIVIDSLTLSEGFREGVSAVKGAIDSSMLKMHNNDIKPLDTGVCTLAMYDKVLTGTKNTNPIKERKSNDKRFLGKYIKRKDRY